MFVAKSSSSHNKPQLNFILIVPVVLLLVIIGIFFKLNFWGNPSEMKLMRNVEGVEQPVDLKNWTVAKTVQETLKIQNPDAGICAVDGQLSQNGKSVNLYSYTNTQDGIWTSSKKFTADLNLNPAAEAMTAMQEGDANLKITVKNCALFNNTTELTVALKLDLTPPRVSLTSTQHYINQGGADVATYTVSDDATWSGIRIGKHEFMGYPIPGGAPNARFAFFVYSYELPVGTAIEVIAKDAAGNIGKSTLAPSKFFPKEFRHRELNIDDGFINTKIADIISNTSSLKNTADPLQNFLLVNSTLRKTNAQFLKDISAKSKAQFFWKDAFLPLVNSAVEASFADYRSYMYGGAKVDEQVHLGFDFAGVQNMPVRASGAGQVLFSDYLGIYGNTVIVDHGYGIITLYAHLSSMDVKVGDLVAHDQKIANTGATGLAGGDHLHYSMLIQGVQTNPIEFWDQHWIEDHVYLRLNKELFGK